MPVFVTAGVGASDFPRIGWRALSGTVTASSAATGYEATRATKVETYDGWRPTSLPATWEINAGAAVNADYCGIGAHDLAGCVIEVQRWAGSGFANVLGPVEVTDNSAVLALFAAATATRWRLRIVGGPRMPTLGHIRFGEALAFPRRSRYLGLPIDESRMIEYRQNRSEMGDFLGRNVRFQGNQFDLEIENIPEEFRQGPWREFTNYLDAGAGTFFIAGKPESYPLEVAYAWPTGTFRAERTRPNRRISTSVNLSCEGYYKP